ncbi:MAG: GtrA family protein [Cytophagales bacterium]|nr:GtrA family protein [Cytophagales bacterium]
MRSKLLSIYRSNELYKQVFRFGIVGTLSAVSEFGVLILLVEKFGLAYLQANLIAFCIIVIANYIASRLWIFGAGSFSKSIEFISFFAVVLIGLGINQAAMYFWVEVFAFDYRIAKILALGGVIIWNFLAKKYFVFRRPKPATMVVSSEK